MLRNWAVSVLANMLALFGVGTIEATDCIAAEERVHYTVKIQAERSVWNGVGVWYRVKL